MNMCASCVAVMKTEHDVVYSQNNVRTLFKQVRAFDFRYMIG